MQSVLATQFVEFVAKGFDTVQSVIGEFQKKITEANKAADLLKQSLESGAYARAAQQVAATNSRMAQLNAEARKIDLEARFGKIGAAVTLANESFGKFNGIVRQGVGMIIGPAAVAFGMLTGTVMGFVRAGLQGSVEGYRLNLMFSLLGKEIAGIFLPVVNKVTDGLQRLVGWFQRLSGSQQDALMRITLIGAAILATTVAVGGLIIGVMGLIGAVLSLTASLVAMNVPLAGIPMAIGLVVTALSAIAGSAVAAGTAVGVMSQRGGSVLDKLTSAAQAAWNFIKPLVNVLEQQFRVLARIYDIGERLHSALVRPFEQFFSRLMGGRSLLDRFAAGLETIATVLERLTPMFEAGANIFEAGLTVALDRIASFVERAEGLIARVRKAFASMLPPAVVAIFDRLAAFARPGAKEEAPHRRPGPMDAGFETGDQAWKRVAVAVSKLSATKGPEEKIADDTEEVRRIAEQMEKKIDDFFKLVNPILEAIAAGGNVLPVAIIRSLINALR